MAVSMEWNVSCFAPGLRFTPLALHKNHCQPSLAPPHKQDSSLGVAAQWERHVAGVETLLFLGKNKVTLLKSSPSRESQ